MGWRDYKLPTPIDKIDKIDKTPLPEHPRTGFVDKVGFVNRVQSIKNPSPVHYKPSDETLPEMVRAICDKITEKEQRIPPMTDADKELIDWFLSADLPQEPFDLDCARRVLNPVKFYASLHQEIESRLSSPRWRCGATQGDLKVLRNGRGIGAH